MGKKAKRRSAWNHDPARIAAAEKVLRLTKSLPREPERLLACLAENHALRPPLRSESNVLAGLFASLDRKASEPFALQPDREVLRELVSFCQSQTDLLTDQNANSYASALLALSAQYADWVRPVDMWRARTHNALRQFRSLLRHLIARYDVPIFMDTAWLEGVTAIGVKYQRWYKHLGSGQNIRTLDDLPITLTRKQAHCFLQAPDDFDIPSAFRWAQIIDLGGDEPFVRTILTTRIGTTFENVEFWTSVLRWLLAQPGVATHRIGPIFDYLHNQKFEPTVANPHADEPDQPRFIPAHPGLRMKGRTIDGMLKAMLSWHRDLRSVTSATVKAWDSSGFSPFRLEDGTGDASRIYQTVELLTWDELHEEGTAMKNCVLSYARACASRRTSIWSLRVANNYGRLSRVVTLEVNNTQRRIVQIRRQMNKMPTGHDLSVLNQWAEAGGPKLAYWYTP